MVELLDRAERRIASLEARLAKIEDDGATSSGAVAHRLALPATVSPAVTMEEVSSRRGLFKVAGAVASAAVAHNLLSASPAAASTTGPYVGLNVVETTTTKTGVTMTPSAGDSVAFQGTNLATAGSADGVKGVSDNKVGAGVAGSSAEGYGVFGSTGSGYAVYSNGRLGIGQHQLNEGVPTSGGYELGDIIRDIVGNMFVCVDAGSAAANATNPAAFRKIAGPSSAGQLHVSPITRRAYDCRASEVTGQRAAQGGEGVFVNGTIRTVDLGVNFPGTSEPLVALGATAAMVTVAVFSIRAEGFLTLYPTGTAAPSALHAYWGGAVGTQTSTLAVVKLNALRRFDMRSSIAGGPDVSVAIDVVGFYL